MLCSPTFNFSKQYSNPLNSAVFIYSPPTDIWLMQFLTEPSVHCLPLRLGQNSPVVWPLVGLHRNIDLIYKILHYLYNQKIA